MKEIFSLKGHVVNWIYPLAWLITDTWYHEIMVT